MAEKKGAGKAKTGAASKAAKAPAALNTVPEWASTTAVAKLLGKTTRRIQQLTQDGVLETEVPPGGGARKYKTCETIQRYIAHIEQKAQETAAASSTAELNLRKLEAEVELKESQGQLHKLKTAIAEGIAQRIAQGQVPARLQNKEIYLLDLTALVAGTQFRGQF